MSSHRAAPEISKARCRPTWRAIAGVTVPLVDETFEPDATATLVEQG